MKESQGIKTYLEDCAKVLFRNRMPRSKRSTARKADGLLMKEMAKIIVTITR